MKPAPLEMDYETFPPPRFILKYVFLPSKQSDVVLVLRLAYCHLYQALLLVFLNVSPNFNLYIQVTSKLFSMNISVKVLPINTVTWFS